MTHEQRERHLARRRRNYQLRRQRAANAIANVNVPFSPLTPQPHPHFPHSSTGENSSSADLQWATPSSDRTVLTHGHNLGQDTSEIVEGDLLLCLTLVGFCLSLWACVPKIKRFMGFSGVPFCLMFYFCFMQYASNRIINPIGGSAKKVAAE